jgi:hypothetical protein
MTIGTKTHRSPDAAASSPRWAAFEPGAEQAAEEYWPLKRYEVAGAVDDGECRVRVTLEEVGLL